MPVSLVWVALLGAAGLLAGCGGGAADRVTDEVAAPRITGEIVQLRSDEALDRLQVTLTNRSAGPVLIESIDLTVPGFVGAGVQVKGEPLPAGQRVNLPTPYGEVRCSADGAAEVGRPRVVARVSTDDATGPSRQVVLRPTDPEGVLARIAERDCLTRMLLSRVELTFGSTWRETGAGDSVVLHGTLEARLLTGAPFDITQVAGTVIYDLAPEAPDAAGVPEVVPGRPLARLTAASPRASVPVAVRVSRCDGHARAETKKPYEFLVWLAPPGGAERAVTPTVSSADRRAFARVCPL